MISYGDDRTLDTHIKLLRRQPRAVCRPHYDPAGSGVSL